jgi:hypothetical protein
MFRRKTLTKKTKQVPLKQLLREEARIADIKKVKAGQKRRRVLNFSYELALRAELTNLD